MAKFHGQFDYSGLYPTGKEVPGCWMRDKAMIRFRSVAPPETISIKTSFLRDSENLHSTHNQQPLLLSVKCGSSQQQVPIALESGDTEIELKLTKHSVSNKNHELELKLGGVGLSNFLGLLGRLFEKSFWLPASFRKWLQPFRRQHNNRQLLVQAVALDGHTLINFEQSHSAFRSDFLFQNSDIGFNVIGWFHGYLGVGESARACVRASREVGFDVDCVNLKLRLNGGQSESLWEEPFVPQGRKGITIAHLDAPQSLDFQKLHSEEMKSDCYRIGYWAWELSEFPDAWIQYTKVFDEIWCPSEFCRKAIAAKSSVPVFSMPHAITLPEVAGDQTFWRNRFHLPDDRFLFLFTFDLNSYSPRKNPEAVIEAYRKAFASRKDMQEKVGLILKVHGRGYNPKEREMLKQLQAELPGVYLVDETLTREELTGLQFASDAFVSLHRSEGFGLGVAEMMALGKPVISTDWSATTEFVDETIGCPVKYKLIELEHNVGPYTKGQVWADADTDDAAQWMLRLVEDREFCKELGENAKKHVKEHLSPARIGALYKERVKAIALF